MNQLDWPQIVHDLGLGSTGAPAYFGRNFPSSRHLEIKLCEQFPQLGVLMLELAKSPLITPNTARESQGEVKLQISNDRYIHGETEFSYTCRGCGSINDAFSRLTGQGGREYSMLERAHSTQVR